MKNEPRTPLAFPQDFKNMHYFGLTIRDYFAAKAMQGLIAQSDGSALSSNVDMGAQYAYQMADAMLAQRERDND